MGCRCIVDVAMLATKITNLTICRSSHVARRDFGTSIRIKVRASAGAVSITGNSEFMDVID